MKVFDYDKKNVWHVYPINDSARHILKGYFCECNPKVEIQPNKALLVTHMALMEDIYLKRIARIKE